MKRPWTGELGRAVQGATARAGIQAALTRTERGHRPLRLDRRSQVTANDLRLDGLSILVLEDEYILADDARRVLLHAGAEVIGPYGDADEALTAAEQSRPDCALLNLDLGTGPDFGPARALKRLGVPLVFFTGYDLAVAPPDLRNERFVEKPVSMAAIIGVVASACGRSVRGRARSWAGYQGRAPGEAGV
jgi:FixJ family two-component response regulator